MSNIPVYQTIDASFGQGVTVPTEPMEQTNVQGYLNLYSSTAPADQVQLTAGEVVTVSASATSIYGQTLPAGIAITGPDGSTVAQDSTTSGNPGVDPETGQATWGADVVFRAPTTGTYTLNVSDTPSGSPFDSYGLSVRPIEQDTSTLAPDENADDAAKLAFQGGGLYAFLDPTDTVLTLDGPTGRGFQITGQFSETVTPVPGSSLTTATITATGSSIALDSGLGPINIPLLPGTSFTVTTQANGYGGLFGEVASAGLAFVGESIIQDIVTPLSSQVGLDLSGLGITAETPGVEFGIALGDDPAVAGDGNPVNPAVPYLYLNVSTGFSASFGKVEASAEAKGASVVVDPADPSIFVDIKGLPGVSNLQFGLSEHGYIPFEAAQDPNHWGDQALYGDVFFGGTLNVADLTKNEVPVSITGQTVINFDTDAGPWTSGVAQKVEDLFDGNATLQEMETEVYGVNGTGSLTFATESGLEVSVALQAGTLIIDGPQQSIYFRNGAVNPFEGTPLAFLDTNSNGAAQGFTEDGYLNFGNGNFDGTLYGNFTLDQVGISGSLEVSNTQVSATGSFNDGVLSGSLTGTIYWWGGFDLEGTASVYAGGDISVPNLGDLYGTVSGQVNLDLNSDGYASIWGDANVSGSAYVFGNYVGGINQDAYFSICTTDLGDVASSFFSEAGNAVDSAVDSLYSDWEQAQQEAESAAQQIQSGWNWFWGGSWL